MAQTANPYGFSPVGAKVSNTAYGYSVSQYPINVSNATIGNGDPVAFFGAGIGTQTGTVSQLTALSLAAAANCIPMLGVFAGCSYQPSQGQTNPQKFQSWVINTPTAANTVPVAYVEDMPFTVFQVQCNGSLATWAANTGAGSYLNALGQSFSFAYGAVNSVTGQSTAALDVTNAAATGLPIATGLSATAPFKLIGIATISGNSITDPYPDVLVVPNHHFFKAGTRSITV